MTETLWKNTEDVDKNFKADPIAWLVKQAKSDMDILLAHADDGVIWGKVKGNTLLLAGSEFPEIDVKLREQTLQQARLFGPGGELLIWRVDDNFEARLIADGDNPPGSIEEECQWLWGAKDTRKEGEIFTLLREGKQGLLHAPPLAGLKNNQGIALKVRHYIENDDKGQAYIALSRLTGLKPVEERENVA